MNRIRIGNDFVFIWAITRGGLPEDLTNISDASLTVSVLGNKKTAPFVIDGNNVKIEFTPLICNIIGTYNLKFEYSLPDVTLSDSERKCTIDVDAFQIVPRTADADDSSEFSVTYDMAIAFQGKSAYEVWLETNTGTYDDYIAFLRQPATDAAIIANQAANNANIAATDANTATTNANNAATAANTAAQLADDARLAIQDDLSLKLESVIYSEIEYNEV